MLCDNSFVHIKQNLTISPLQEISLFATARVRCKGTKRHRKFVVPTTKGHQHKSVLTCKKRKKNDMFVEIKRKKKKEKNLVEIFFKK